MEELSVKDYYSTHILPVEEYTKLHTTPDESLSQAHVNNNSVNDGENLCKAKENEASFATLRNSQMIRDVEFSEFSMIAQSPFITYPVYKQKFEKELAYAADVISKYNTHYFLTIEKNIQSWSYAVSKQWLIETDFQTESDLLSLFTKNVNEALLSRAAAIPLFSAIGDAVGAPFEFLERIDPTKYPKEYCDEITKELGQPVGNMDSQHLFIYLNKRQGIKKLDPKKPNYEETHELLQFPLDIKLYDELNKSFSKENKKTSKRFVTYYGRDSYDICESAMVGAEQTSEGFFESKFCGYWTDDTCQATCLADTLIITGRDNYFELNTTEFAFAIYDWWNHSYGVPFPRITIPSFELKILQEIKDSKTAEKYRQFIESKKYFVSTLIERNKKNMFMSFGLGKHEKMFLLYLMDFLGIEKLEPLESMKEEAGNDNSSLQSAPHLITEEEFLDAVKRKKAEKEEKEIACRENLNLKKHFFLPVMYSGTNSNGDGTLMRNAPICALAIQAIVKNNPVTKKDYNPKIIIDNNLLENVMALAMTQSFTTQNGYASAQCCAVQVYVVVHFVKLGIECELDFARSIADNKKMKVIDYYELIHKRKQKLMESTIFWDDCEATLCRVWNRILLQKAEIDTNINKEDAHKLDSIVLKIIKKIENYNWCTKKLGVFEENNWKANPHYVGIEACDSLYMMLNAAYRCKTPYSMIVDAGCRGGDADTLACMTGCLCGALFGVWHLPPNWVTTLSTVERVPGEIAARGVILSKILGN